MRKEQIIYYVGFSIDIIVMTWSGLLFAWTLDFEMLIIFLLMILCYKSFLELDRK